MAKELFIGREEMIDRFHKDVFCAEPVGKTGCYSLIGLNGIGKTTLIGRLAEEFENDPPPNTFYYPTEMEDGITFWSFWGDLIRRFSEDINEEYIATLVPQPNMAQRNAISKIMQLYRLVNEGFGQATEEEYRGAITRDLNDLFKHYTKLGIRIIITIDEFDRAQHIFSDGQFFQRLYVLSPKGGKELNLSIVTLSRRRVSTIAHHMQQGSDLEEAYPMLVLKGFNDEELEQYFASYEALPCGKLSETTQNEILYLCGRSPSLLMRFRHEVELRGDSDVSVSKIYAENGQFIKTAFSRMVTLMETSFSDRKQEKPILNLFVQKFIGPAYEEDFEPLYSYGFVTQSSAAESVFARLGEVPQDGDASVYEPISPYFVEYVKYQILPDALEHLAKSLIHAEKLVRKVIEKELRLLFPETWEDVVNRYAQKKDFYLETLQVKVLRNDFTGSISKLNVISFKEYYYIMNDYWHVFSKYFTAYPSKNALFTAMCQLGESRNFSAHLNLVVYSGENRRKLQETCDTFVSCLENDPQNAAAPATTAPAPAAVPPARPTRPAPAGATPTEAQIAALLGTTVTFSCQAIKPQNKNLRGVIKENGFPAGISNKALALFDLGRPARVNDELTAVVERWDYNAGMFNLKAPRKV